MQACYRRKIPVYSVSSIFRPNKVFFRWYGKGYSKVLRYVTHFFVQDEESRQLLSLRDVRDNVTVVGDTRFDRVLDICHQAKDLPLLERFASDAPFVFVAGSSWAPDEDLIVPYFNAHPGMKLILAPHVISEEHLTQIENKLKRPSLRYTEATEDNVSRADCLIINCFDLLSSIYRYAHVAYVGGGFGAGIHNVPEAAVYGIPVLIGPNNKGFREAQDLLRLGGCFEITGQTLFNAVVSRLMSKKKLRQQCGAIGKHYIESNAGAADKIFQMIETFLSA
jgi:3-deoxy-D-manno-octulosonic-acid transferase